MAILEHCTWRICRWTNRLQSLFLCTRSAEAYKVSLCLFNLLGALVSLISQADGVLLQSNTASTANSANTGLTSLNYALINNVWYQEIQRSFRDILGEGKLNYWQIQERQL